MARRDGKTVALTGIVALALASWLGAQAPSPSLPGQVKSRLEKGGATAGEGKSEGEKAATPTPPGESRPGVTQRRDPFRSLLIRAGEEGVQQLPPGKAGLVVAQISVNGIVVTASGRIAVVSMAGRNRAYFLRERDQLFNGAVSKIGDDSVIFRERTRDAFGREYEREVVKQVVAGTTRPGARR